jgi:hypothetical protein
MHGSAGIPGPTSQPDCAATTPLDPSVAHGRQMCACGAAFLSSNNDAVAVRIGCSDANIQPGVYNSVAYNAKRSERECLVSRAGAYGKAMAGRGSQRRAGQVGGTAGRIAHGARAARAHASLASGAVPRCACLAVCECRGLTLPCGAVGQAHVHACLGLGRRCAPPRPPRQPDPPYPPPSPRPRCKPLDDAVAALTSQLEYTFVDLPELVEDDGDSMDGEGGCCAATACARLDARRRLPRGRDTGPHKSVRGALALVVMACPVGRPLRPCRVPRRRRQPGSDRAFAPLAPCAPKL